MSCKSAIYTVNDTGISITTTNSTPVQVPYGSVIRRFGQGVRLEGGSLQCNGLGYFDVDEHLIVTPVAAGPITVQLYQDGQAVRGASATLTGAVGVPLDLPIKALVRNCGCDCNIILTTTINGSCVVNNFPTVVKKL